MKSRTALLGLSPSTPSCSLSATTVHFNLQGYLQNTLTCSSSLPSHLHVLRSQAAPVPVLGSKAGPSTLPEGVPGTETSLGLRGWRKSLANQAQRGQGWL